MGTKLAGLLAQLKDSPERVDEVLMTYRKKLHKAKQDIRNYKIGIDTYTANIERLEGTVREYELLIELFDTLKEDEA